MGNAIYYSGNLTDALHAFDDKPKWLIEPYLPVEGIVLLHGKFSLGKSPLIWRLAQCVSEGIDFFGHTPQQTGTVVYAEIDQPLVVTNDRLALLNPMPKKVHLLGVNPFSVLRPTNEDKELLQEVNETVKPALVLVNSLRKSHTLDDKDSATPSMVYGAWRSLFPESCLVFVHHDKKSDVVDGKRVEADDEDFSGSQAWVNDAQIGLHLKPIGDRRTGLVALEMTKSQLSALQEPLKLKLGKDGVNWIDEGAEHIKKVFATFPPDTPKMKRYELTAAACQTSVRSVRRALQEQ